jgi:predicted dehydrogenase
LIEDRPTQAPPTDSTHGLTFALAGAGARGQMFSDWLCTNFGAGAVVAVAEPNEERRNTVAAMHGISEDKQFASWQEMLRQPRLADILLNTTMDGAHLESSVLAMRAGYHMLLEKPMATTLEDCIKIDRVRQETQRVVSICHSLRYHPVYEQVRKIIRSGLIGDVVNLDQLEAVEIAHQAHSFVRGNWSNEDESTFMLLAKSCHDIDIIVDLIDRDCVRVSSYGSLYYFNRQNQPIGAPDYCVEGCPVEGSCPYSSLKLYVGDKPYAHIVGFAKLTSTEARERLRTSPYGRCVFKTDNNVVDHQVVAMEFEGGVTATFTMTAFTPSGGRHLRVYGTKGYIEAKIDERTIDLYEFWAGNKHSHIEIPEEQGPHGGADASVMKSLMAAVSLADPSSVRTTTTESLRSHSVVFAAEKSRREGRQIRLEDLSGLSQMFQSKEANE